MSKKDWWMVAGGVAVAVATLAVYSILIRQKEADELRLGAEAEEKHQAFQAEERRREEEKEKANEKARHLKQHPEMEEIDLHRRGDPGPGRPP